MDRDQKLQLANLHDAFMNASLQRNRMLKEPLDSDPQAFMVSDRGRFERTWLTFLYVLIECWQSKQMKEIRDFITAHVPVHQLDKLLLEGEQKGLIRSLSEVRHYMCHRDERDYWNEGRIAVSNLIFNTELHEEFSRVLLTALDAVGDEKKAN